MKDNLSKILYEETDFSKPLILCVSGGKDSMTMLHLLLPFKKELIGGLEVIYFNHGLRKKSEQEQSYLERLSEKKGFTFTSFKLEVRRYSGDTGFSIEEAARYLRYSKLSEYTSSKKPAGYIFTAHTASDQLETILFRLLKGSGRKGFQAIREEISLSSGWKVRRPMLSVTSEEIRSYIKKNKIKYFEDSTNKDETIPRNFLRHKVISRLKTINPSVEKNISKEISVWTEEENYLDSIVSSELSDLKKEITSSEIRVELPRLLSYNKWLKRRLIRALSPVDLDYNRLEAVIDLFYKTGSLKSVDIGAGWCARKEYEELVFEKVRRKQKDFSYRVIPGRELFIKELCKTVRSEIIDRPKPPAGAANIEVFDISMIDVNDITVRPKKNGDRISPFGMHGEKKIKDLCIDLKLPLSDRRSMLIFEEKNRIIWAAPFRRSSIAPVSDKTEKALRLELV